MLIKKVNGVSIDDFFGVKKESNSTEEKDLNNNRKYHSDTNESEISIDDLYEKCKKVVSESVTSDSLTTTFDLNDKMKDNGVLLSKVTIKNRYNYTKFRVMLMIIARSYHSGAYTLLFVNNNYKNPGVLFSTEGKDPSIKIQRYGNEVFGKFCKGLD